jgi:hypothetical protein
MSEFFGSGLSKDQGKQGAEGNYAKNELEISSLTSLANFTKMQEEYFAAQQADIRSQIAAIEKLSQGDSSLSLERKMSELMAKSKFLEDQIGKVIQDYSRVTTKLNSLKYRR